MSSRKATPASPSSPDTGAIPKTPQGQARKPPHKKKGKKGKW
jgi:hypothetical protein